MAAFLGFRAQLDQDHPVVVDWPKGTGERLMFLAKGAILPTEGYFTDSGLKQKLSKFGRFKFHDYFEEPETGPAATDNSSLGQSPVDEAPTAAGPDSHLATQKEEKSPPSTKIAKKKNKAKRTTGGRQARG